MIPVVAVESKDLHEAIELVKIGGPMRGGPSVKRVFVINAEFAAREETLQLIRVTVATSMTNRKYYRGGWRRKGRKRRVKNKQ